MLLLPWVSADLRKTDFTFCAPHTWNKLEPDAVRAAGHSPLINSEYKGCNLFVWINPRILFLHFRTHTCVCVFFLVCAKIHVLGMLAKVKHSRPHLAALISQIGRAVSWWDQASLEAWTWLPHLPVSENSSLEPYCQARHRLCDRQTAVCGRPQWTRAIDEQGPIGKEEVSVLSSCMCVGTRVCVCVREHIYAYSPDTAWAT